jgi:hypothetical protein
MNFLTTAVPYWVSILFLIVLPIPVFLIARLVKNSTITAGFEHQKAHRFFWTIIIFYTVFLVYASAMCFAGKFVQASIPPKVVQFTTIPLVLFFTLIVTNLKIYKPLLAATKLQDLVSIHLFRLIGGFFIHYAYCLWCHTKSICLRSRPRRHQHCPI